MYRTEQNRTEQNRTEQNRNSKIKYINFNTHANRLKKKVNVQ